jgi:hypothetical protein
MVKGAGMGVEAPRTWFYGVLVREWGIEVVTRTLRLVWCSSCP